MNVASLILWHLCTHLRLSLASPSEPRTKTNYPSPPPPQYNEAVDNGTYGYYPTLRYTTAPDLDSPQTNFLQWDERCDDGLYYFLTPRGWGLPTPGPMILNSRGELVWAKHFDNQFGGQAYGFMVQEYEGEEYLTFWLGDDRVRGHGSGYYYMLNSSYDIVHRVGAANGLSADLHEFFITPQGTALMTMYQVVAHDVTAFRDFDPENPDDADPNYIWDCLFQEVDVATGELIYEWRASEHVEIADTYHEVGPGGTKVDPYDWFHINSIEKDELGNYLVSARYTHSIYYISGVTGDVLWTVGGKGNDFLDLSDGFAVNFAWQHDARFVDGEVLGDTHRRPAEQEGVERRLVSLFDNAAEDQHYEYGMTFSRGLLLEVTYPTSDIVRSGQHEQELDASAHADGELGGDGMAKRQEYYTDTELNTAKVSSINGTNHAYTVRVVKSYENPSRVRSSSQGSMQILSGSGSREPRILVGYGLNALWTEFSANDGSVLCDAHYGATTSWERGDIQSYRIYKFAWTGRPEIAPSVDISDDDVEVYVSWNGATEVREWVVQCSETGGGSDEEQESGERGWADVVKVRKTGFETIIPLPTDANTAEARYLRVIALDSSGRRLDYGVSETIDRGLMATYLPLMSDKETVVGRVTPVKVFLGMVSALSGAVILYEVYRRYLSWRTGRPGGGALRWRKGHAYRILGEA